MDRAMEKNGKLLALPVAMPASSRTSGTTTAGRRRHAVSVGFLGLVALLYLSLRTYLVVTGPGDAAAGAPAKDWCNLLPPVAPADDGLESSFHLMSSAQRALQVKRLSAAVQVPTESFDDSGDVGVDPRWEIFGEFHALLEKHYPSVYKHFTVETVNTYGLLYTLPGRDASLKPILFMAHQDVVPADASAPWTHPPFSGHYDGTWVWGRGSGDCKNVLVGLLSTLEDLLAQPAFAPRRTIVLSFGFDEEVSGQRGAHQLSRALEARWGPDAFVLVLDEGGMGIQEVASQSGVLLASPGVGEKGYVDVVLTITAPGGHSSRPPAHTGIGILADVIHALEAAPYTPVLQQTSPFRRVLECRARHVPAAVPAWLAGALQHDSESAVAEKLVSTAGDDQGVLEEGEAWLMQTSQAADVITGGIKVNALPEKAQVVVNYRVALHESVAVVKAKIHRVLAPVVRQHELRFVDESTPEAETPAGGAAVTEEEEDTSVATLTMTSFDDLPVAPLSPTDNGVWAQFAGVLRSIFETTDTGRNKTVVPVGSIMTGNTDTRYYWPLSRNIYRFAPSRDGTRLNAHAIDERMEMTAHLEGMRFYYDLIRTFDQWDEE